MDVRHRKGFLHRMRVVASRRTTLRVALASIFALPEATHVAAGPAPAGPCGPKPDRNRCRKNADCCTDRCRRGACRYVTPGGRCHADKQCRGGVCFNGRCGSLG